MTQPPDPFSTTVDPLDNFYVKSTDGKGHQERDGDQGQPEAGRHAGALL